MKIEINLLPGAKKKRRGGGPSFELPDFGELSAQFKDPLLLGAIGAVVLGLGVTGTVWFLEKDRISSLQPQLDVVQQEARQFQSMINERNRQQQLRDSLIVDLDALREIDGDRFVWPHIMDEVTNALPDFTWIVSLDALTVQGDILPDGTIAPTPVQFSLEGRTSDLQAFTMFIAQLENSPWLRDISPGGTQTVVESDQAVTSFEVTATFAPADSAFIQTVPLSQLAGQGS